MAEIAAPVAPSPKRKAGFLLGLGIFLFPPLFAWFMFRKGHSTAGRVIALGWLIVFLLWWLMVAGASQDPARVHSGGAAEAKVDLNDAQALEAKYEIPATSACDVYSGDYIRSVARHDFKWDDSTKGMFGEKFDKFMTKAPSPGVLVLTSDKLMLQNGFGAYTRVQILCRYDTQAAKVLGFEILED